MRIHSQVTRDAQMCFIVKADFIIWVVKMKYFKEIKDYIYFFLIIMIKKLVIIWLKDLFFSNYV